MIRTSRWLTGKPRQIVRHRRARLRIDGEVTGSGTLRFHASVGLTTTMLAVAADEPYGRSVLASTAHRRAAKAIADGRALRIVSASYLGLDQKA